MTSEPSTSDYFQRLRALLPGEVVFARDRAEVNDAMRPYGDDNYFLFEVLRQLGAHADARIGTTACYLAGGCEVLLANERAEDDEGC